MKKGFTLIELLAVIVILAIIALIATPIVLNIIDEVNQSSNVISMQNIEKAVKLYYASNQIKENIVFECIDGVCKNGENVLQIKGKAPTEGKILVDKNGNVTYSEIILNGYNCYKEQDKHVCSKDKIRKTFTENSIVINTSKESKLLDYKVYGSEYELGKRTDNLFNLKNAETIYRNGKVVESKTDIGYTLTNANTTANFIVVKIGNTSEWFGKTLTLSYNATNSGSIVWIYFDENGNNRKQLSSSSITVDNTNVCFGIRLNASTTNPSLVFEYTDIQIEESSTVTDYESYGYKIPVKVIGKNLFDINGAKNGTMMSTTGAHYELETNRSISDFIYLKAGEYTYILNGGIYAGNTHFFSKANETTRIGNVIPSVVTKDGTSICTFIVPHDCYVRTVFLPVDSSEITNLDIEMLKTLKVMLYANENSQEYEPYKELTTNIYINEPLRCVNDKCDYIDFKNQKVVRYIEKLEDETLKILDVPKQEKIELPEILLNKGINHISVETSVSPSKIELEYYK